MSQDIRANLLSPLSYNSPLKEMGITAKANAGDHIPGVDSIPIYSLHEIGAIFDEGEPKYGRDNWKNGAYDEQYQRERLRHAMTHLGLWANGDRTENHLAKVAWFCVTQLELQRMERVGREIQGKGGPRDVVD